MASRKAQAEKEKGNVCFKAGKYADAIGHYTAAILADGNDYTFPLNRAAAYLRLGKNEDAERDCTTVLRLSVGNAKALYRRGQARLAMGSLEEAEEDLKKALKREPADVAIQEELKKASGLLEKKAKAFEPPSEPKPQRRRVPIKIIDPSASTSTSSSSYTDHPVRSASSRAASDTLRAVSTRSLKQDDAPAPPAKPVPPTPAPMDGPTPVRASSASASASAPNPPHQHARTFKDAKQARENSRPSRVGGGIFRASGENTIFPTRTTLSATRAAEAEAEAEAVPEAIVPVPPVTPPKTCFDFTRAWDAQREIAARWGLILSVPPSSVPALFKISLEPALLMAILAVFKRVLGAAGGEEHECRSLRARVRGYMDALGEVDRFGTVVLFLSREEKALARDVWEALGVSKQDTLESAWKSVWK